MPSSMNRRQRVITYVFIPLLLILGWFVIVHLRLVSPIFLPKPEEVVRSFFVGIGDGTLLTDVVSTVYRMAGSFALAVAIGVPVGLLMGYSRRVYLSLEFLVEFFRSIPASALLPLFLLVFGIGDATKIALSAWAATLIIVINTMHGVHMSKELRFRAAKAMRIGEVDLLRRVVFPEALPQIFAGFRVALSISLVVVIIAEMAIGTRFGLGHRIVDAQFAYHVDDMYMSIFLTGILGFAMNKLVIVLEKRIIHWKGK